MRLLGCLLLAIICPALMAQNVIGVGRHRTVGAHPAPTIVQVRRAATNFITTLSDVTSGNVLVVSFLIDGTSSSATASDTRGTVYTKASASVSGQPHTLVMFYGQVTSSGPDIITVSGGSGTFIWTAYVELANVTVPPVENSSAAGYFGTTPSSQAITTSGSTIIIGVTGGFHNINVFSWAAPFTIDDQGGGNDAMAIGHSIQPTGGTYTLTSTITVGAADNSPTVLLALPY